MNSACDFPRKPIHPGLVLKNEVLPKLGLTQTEFAKRLLISRVSVSYILHEKMNINAETAVRISRVVGGSPDRWLQMQQALDVWRAEVKFMKHPELAPKINDATAR
jgi:addiction module HigA family antidote